MMRWILLMPLAALVLSLGGTVVTGCTPRPGTTTRQGSVSAEEALKLATAQAQVLEKGRPDWEAKLDLSQGTVEQGVGVWYVVFPYRGGGGGLTFTVDQQTGRVDETPIAWDPALKALP